MNFKYIIVGAYLMAMVGGVSCSHSNSSEHDEHEHEHVHEHGENDGDEDEDEADAIVFTPEKAEKFGVKTVVVEAKPYRTPVKVTGEILSAQGENYTVTAPTSGVVKVTAGVSQGAKVGAGATICSVTAENMTGGDSNQRAKIEYEAAKRELERITPLYEDKIVTRKEYNAALEAYDIAKNAYQPSKSGKLTASTAIGGVVVSLDVTDGQYVEAGQPIAVVSRNARLQLRADVPERASANLAGVKSANVKTSAGVIVSLDSLNVKRVSANTGNVVASGYIPVFFEFNNDGRLSQGSFVEVYLLSDNTRTAITVPTGAVLEELGNYYVFVQLDEDCYDKRKVTLGMSDGNNVEILSGLKDGENVVSVGMMYIRLAGNSSEIPAGCEHHHH